MKKITDFYLSVFPDAKLQSNAGVPQNEEVRY